MKKISTSVDIKATSSQVWEVLTDFEKYEEWNPFIKVVTGKLELGASLEVEMELKAGKRNRFKPQIKVLEPGRELQWLGQVGMPGIFDGRHIFRLEQRGESCRLYHEEEFSGILIPVAMPFMASDILNAFEAMNKALKDRVES
jgi:hypothetical protein